MTADTRNSLFIALTAGLFFIPFLGGVHLFEWDEINFAELAREMIERGEYFNLTINYEPFWEKPPLFIWFQVVSMKIFGVNEFAARFPNAVCGILTLLVLYRIGKTIVNRRFAIWWVLAYFGSVLPHLYFRSGIMDPWFNLFIFLSLYQLIKYFNKDEPGKIYHTLAGGIYLGMAILIKGPAAILIVGLAGFVYLIVNRFKWFIPWKGFIVYGLTALLVTGIWFGAEYLSNGPWFIKTFVKYQWRLFSTPDAGHGGFPGYHFAVALIGCFPASIFAIRAMKKDLSDTGFVNLFRKWMIILLAVVLVLFSIVQSKIVHYSSMAYFPITFLAALTLTRIGEGKIRFANWIWISGAIITLIYITAAFLLPHFGAHPEQIRPLLKNDIFGYENSFAEVDWRLIHTLPGVLLGLSALVFLYLGPIKKKFVPASRLLLVSFACFTALAIYMYIDRLETYSQKAAIEFYKEKGKLDAYVTPGGYKSYGYLFYGNVKMPDDTSSLDRDWKLYGEIDKPVYIVVRASQKENYKKAGWDFLGDKNGYYFFRRNVPEPPKPPPPPPSSDVIEDVATF